MKLIIFALVLEFFKSSRGIIATKARIKRFFFVFWHSRLLRGIFNFYISFKLHEKKGKKTFWKENLSPGKLFFFFFALSIVFFTSLQTRSCYCLRRRKMFSVKGELIFEKLCRTNESPRREKSVEHCQIKAPKTFCSDSDLFQEGNGNLFP